MTIVRDIKCMECNGFRRVYVGMPHEDEFTDIYEWCPTCKGVGTLRAQYVLDADGVEVLYWPRTLDEAFAGRRIENEKA